MTGLPGQYYDAETGLHQNWHRDYSATTGRYLQSDPIGLLGGVDTYSYAFQSPVGITDPLGLLGNCGTPGKSCVPPKPQVVSVFGCLLGCVTSPIDGSEPQASLEMTFGGGIEICDPPPLKAQECSVEPPKRCGMYDPNCDNTIQPPSAPVPRRLGLGLLMGFSMKNDGRICTRAGFFGSANLLPAFELGGIHEK